MDNKPILLAQPGIAEAAQIRVLDIAIERLVEQRNAIAASSPFQPPLVHMVDQTQEEEDAIRAVLDKMEALTRQSSFSAARAWHDLRIWLESQEF